MHAEDCSRGLRGDPAAIRRRTGRALQEDPRDRIRRQPASITGREVTEAAAE